MATVGVIGLITYLEVLDVTESAYSGRVRWLPRSYACSRWQWRSYPIHRSSVLFRSRARADLPNAEWYIVPSPQGLWPHYVTLGASIRLVSEAPGRSCGLRQPKH